MSEVERQTGDKKGTEATGAGVAVRAVIGLAAVMLVAVFIAWNLEGGSKQLTGALQAYFSDDAPAQATTAGADDAVATPGTIAGGDQASTAVALTVDGKSQVDIGTAEGVVPSLASTGSGAPVEDVEVNEGVAAGTVEPVAVEDLAATSKPGADKVRGTVNPVDGVTASVIFAPGAPVAPAALTQQAPAYYAGWASVMTTAMNPLTYMQMASGFASAMIQTWTPQGATQPRH